MRGPVLLLVTALGGCPAAEPDPAPIDPIVELDDAERAELVADVQHLLQETVQAQAARDRATARRHWRSAWGLFDRHLLPRMRARDPESALAAEYAFGRLRHAIERRQRADDAVRALDRSLEGWRRRLVGVGVP